MELECEMGFVSTSVRERTGESGGRERKSELRDCESGCAER